MTSSSGSLNRPLLSTVHTYITRIPVVFSPAESSFPWLHGVKPCLRKPHYWTGSDYNTNRWKCARFRHLRYNYRHIKCSFCVDYSLEVFPRNLFELMIEILSENTKADTFPWRGKFRKPPFFSRMVRVQKYNAVCNASKHVDTCDILNTYFSHSS